MQRFEELLTPYVQGHLDERTRRKVERFAESSSDFAELLKFEKQIAGNVKNASAYSAAVLPSFNKLKQRIESRPELGARFTTFLAGLRDAFGRMNSGLVAASVALLAVAVLITVQPNVDTMNDDFRTLSDNVDEVVSVSGRKYFRVVLADDHAPDVIDKLANDLQFVVEAGPNSFGAYAVSIEANDMTAQSTLDSWRADGRFVLVEPTRVAEKP